MTCPGQAEGLADTILHGGNQLTQAGPALEFACTRAHTYYPTHKNTPTSWKAAHVAI
jgi:hypothetical protein